MPLPFPQECNVMLTAISEDIGQINGMAFGCERWNVASLKNLAMHLGALIGESPTAACRMDAIDSMWKSDEERGPILQMLETVQNVLETYGTTPGGLEELAKEPVSRTDAINVLVQNLQTDWLDAVTHITDYYGNTSHPISSNGTSDLAIPEAVWPERPEQIQCWIDAGGGGELKDPQTGDIISIAEAEKRFHWIYDFDYEQFQWNWDHETGEGTPGRAYADIIDLLLEKKRRAQRMEQDEYEPELIHESVRENYRDLWEALREKDEESSEYNDILRDLGFSPDSWGRPLPDDMTERVNRRIDAVLELLPHPREVRTTKDLLDFMDSTVRRREKLIDQDQDLRIAITAAEEIAIEKGREAGSCPPSPEAWFDHRSNRHNELILRGTGDISLRITDPKTGEIIDEGEAIGRLHYEPQEEYEGYPGDDFWWSYTNAASKEAQDVQRATNALQDIMYGIDSQVHRTVLDFADKDREVQSQYENFRRRFMVYKDSKFGEPYGQEGDLLVQTLIDRDVLPRRVRTYAGLAGLIDKMDQVVRELQDEDLAVLGAIMEAEGEAIGKGLGYTPEAWFDQRSNRHRELINRGAGGSLSFTDPKTGEVIEESEAIDRLHFRPYEGRDFYPGDEQWFWDSEAQSERAKGVKRSLTLLQRKQNELGVGAEWGDYPEEGQLDALAREEYSELYSIFSKMPITASLVEEGILPARVRSFAALSSVVSKLQVMELALQAEDEDLLKALMEAEANAIGRGLGQTPSSPSAWEDMTPEEQERWREEVQKKATEARKQIETQLGREIGYMDQDMWDVIMPIESLMEWKLLYPRGDFPHTPLLREERQSIYYAPGWIRIRAYQVKNPHLTVGEIAKDTGYSLSYVSRSLMGDYKDPSGRQFFYGPRLYAARSELVQRQRGTMVERYGAEGFSGLEFEQEIKDAAIQAYLDNPDLLTSEIAERYNIGTRTLQSWINKAGVSFRPPTAPRYSDEFKAKVVQTFLDNPEITQEDIAEQFGISVSSVETWAGAAGAKRGKLKRRTVIDHEAVRAYRRKNPSLSARQIAKDLGISPTRAKTILRGESPSAWADMTPEEQDRWREEAEIRSEEARKQIETELGREEIYLDKDQWDIVMPKQSLMEWTLPWPRGEFPHTPRLREKRKSIYYTPGWVKIRAYQVANPHLSQAQIERDTGYSDSYVRSAIRGENPTGFYYGPRLYPPRAEGTEQAQQTIIERYGKGADLKEFFSAEIRAEAVQVYVERLDLSVDEIGEMYGTSGGTITKWVHDAGVGIRHGWRKNLASPDTRAEAVKTYVNNPSIPVKKIAKMYNIHWTTLFRWLNEAGVALERRGFKPPSAEFGVFYTPEEFDPRIQQYGFWETGVLDYTEDDSPFTDAYFHEGTEVSGEGELLDDEVEMREEMPKQMFLDGEISKAEVVWDVENVRVGISYGPWTSRLGEYIDHAAYVDISSYSGSPQDQFIFMQGGPIQQITKLLDGIHKSNPNIRVVATASTDVEGRGDIRARVYERYGWKRIGPTDASGSVDMELPHPDKRSSGSASAFTGIEQYADAIMELAGDL